jgi:hypothetical protein
VNPSHLFVGTRQENALDAVRKGRHKCNFPKPPTGERAYRAKLTLEQVREIRALRERGASGLAIAKMFPVVTWQTIYSVLSGRSWVCDK